MTSITISGLEIRKRQNAAGLSEQQSILVFPEPTQHRIPDYSIVQVSIA